MEERIKKDLMIGLEVHGYMDTEEKLFCSCKAIHGAKFSKPNTNICPICTGQPGCKPMLTNSTAVEKAIQIALILNCKVNEKLVWQRKHYSWPDLPKGYQNTISGPHAIPLGTDGKFEGIRIIEAHLEEDPAAWNPETGEIDYNRSGSPLIEIVTAPDFTSSEQVVEWLKDLIATLSYIKAIDKNAGIKADVNVSLPKEGTARIEIKNVNLITNIKNAIETEAKRSKKELPVKQETRRYNAEKNTTELMRLKENAEDYRFISDPDLPVLEIKKIRVDKLKKALPETPKEKLERLIKKHKIEKKHAEILTKKLDIVELFEKTIEKVNPKFAIPWITVELMGTLNYAKKELDETRVTPEVFISLLEHVKNGTMTELNAKASLKELVKGGVVNWELRLGKISDADEITDIAKKVIKENAKAVEDFKAGKQNSLNFLIGQVMRLSNKRADFATARKVLEDLLK